MTETTLIADQLGRMAEGEAWHGASIREALEGITPAQAASRPIGNAHTIWEIVHHMTAWAAEVEARLRRDARALVGSADWPPVTKTDAAAWTAAKDALTQAHVRLRMTIREFPPSRLGDPVPNPTDAASVSFYVMLHGLAQHDAYHTGQIAMLKKALIGSAVAAG